MNDPLFPLESLESTDARIRALARSLVFDRSAADDVAQDTWLAALENPPRKRGATNAWLKRVVRNLALFWKRTEDRRRAHEPGGGRPERVASVPEILEREAVRTRLSRVVRELEEPYRTAILYRYFEDLPPRRIAEVLGISGAAVETRLKRGLQKLRARLDRDFGGGGRTWRAGMLALVGMAPAAGSAPARRVARVAEHITGTVRDDGGRPLGGAAVRLLTWGGWRHETKRLLQVKTDSRGVYRLGPMARDAARGPLRLVLEAAAARFYAERRYCRPGTVEHFVLGRGGTITGRVVSVARGDPVASAWVTV
jgi:RNA polymerase sigma-70 factor (ECF subfamily)